MQVNVQNGARKRSGWIQCLILAGMALLPIAPGMGAVPASAAGATLSLQKEEPITAGASLKTYVYQSERKGQAFTTNVRIIQVDLQNPNVKLDVMTGTGGQFTKKQSVLGMAQETGAVAGVNGDFFNTQAEGVPIGPEIQNGKLMATPPYLPGWYSFAVTKDRKPLIDLFTFDGKITAKDGASYPLGGVNKTYYWFEPSGQHSMIDGLFLYTDAWGQEDRSNDGVTVPTEVLVVDNVIQQIAPNAIIPMVAPKNGYILRSSGKAADFVTEHLKVGDPLVADYSILPQDPAKNIDYKSFQMMIGGHTILVDEGKPSAFSRGVSDLEGIYYRTAVGYSKDQRYVYLLAADNSGDSSKGLMLRELQDAMVQAGVWKGMLLDGGGSTQMVARPLGETQVQVINDITYQRRVVNGLGVYSTAPKGQIKGLQLSGPDTAFLGENIAYAFKAYDEYYNPVPASEAAPVWSASGGAVEQTGPSSFRAKAKGSFTVTARAGLAVESKTVQVVGGSELTSLQLNVSPAVLREGDVLTLSAKAKTKSGLERTIPGELLQVELRGFQGRVVGNQLYVDGLSGAQQGQVIARYDGFTTVKALNTGYTQVFGDFDQRTLPFQFEGTAGVTGQVGKVSNGDHSSLFLQLAYDLSKGSGTKAAYAVLGNKDLTVPGAPEAMRLQVRGDNSLNWVRAEFIDSAGAKQLVTVAKAVNWEGWKELSIDLASNSLKYPVKLTRLYVVSTDQLQDERALAGQIGFDQIEFQYKNPDPVPPRSQVSLTIDKRIIQVNGTTQEVDQEPVIVSGNTLVPIRFVSEALGAQVDWSQEELKVTVTKGGQLMEFQLGALDYVADGVRRTAEVAPETRNQRTMVPLRVLSEHFGWTVTWDEPTRTVSLR